MARTEPTGRQIKDGTIQRADLDVSTVGAAVVAKVIAGSGIGLSATGADAGTGDVTVSFSPVVAVKTVNYTLTNADGTIVANSVNPLTMTLPAGTLGKMFTIKNINAGQVTVVTTSGTIDGLVADLIGDMAAHSFLCHDGTNWSRYNDFDPVPQSPMVGGRLLVVGHSYASGAGAAPAFRGWAGQVASMMRSRLWNQAVAGACLGICTQIPTNPKGGGIGQALQQIVPPVQPINWRGAYSSATYYNPEDGVTQVTNVGTCATTNGSPTLSTTTGNYTTSAIVPGMVIAVAGVPPGTLVKSVESTTSLTMSKNATATATLLSVNFTGWYRQTGAYAALHGTAPPAAGWTLVRLGQLGVGSWDGLASIPIVQFGGNDLGYSAQKNQQPFLSALQALFARFASALIWEDNSPMITLSGGTWTVYAYSTGGALGSGTQLSLVPVSGVLTTFTPPDWPGGWVDFHFTLNYTAPNLLATGAINWQVDGANVNCKFNGMADGPLTNFGSPVRQMIFGTSLTAALTTGGAITSIPCKPLPAATVSGDSITVGQGGTAETFVCNGVSAANATAIVVNSRTPSFAHPIGDSVHDASLPTGWANHNCCVVRVPVPAGVHQIIGTVQASPVPARVYFDCMSFEAAPLPAGIMVGLNKYLDLTNSFFPMQPTDADIDTWNAAISAMMGASGEWGPSVFTDIGNLLKQSSTLTTQLTAGQTGVTSLAVTALLVPIASGDVLVIGSGPFQQQVTASASAAVGATSISVTSFTSTYLQAVGVPVSDLNYVAPNFYPDGIHPNNYGHALTAVQAMQTIQASAGLLTPTQTAFQSESIGNPKNSQVIHSQANIAVGAAGTGAWTALGFLTLLVQAEPGDLLEIIVNGLWDTSATVAGFLDIFTYAYYSFQLGQAFPADVINYVSGVAGYSSQGTASGTGLAYNAVGAQDANGLTVLRSPGLVATVNDKIAGTFWYPVQPADINQGGLAGFVALAFAGKSSSATLRNILLGVGSGNNFSWSVENHGPVSYNGV